MIYSRKRVSHIFLIFIGSHGSQVNPFVLPSDHPYMAPIQQFDGGTFHIPQSYGYAYPWCAKPPQMQQQQQQQISPSISPPITPSPTQWGANSANFPSASANENIKSECSSMNSSPISVTSHSPVPISVTSHSPVPQPVTMVTNVPLEG